MPSVPLPNWGDASKAASGSLPLATVAATDVSGKEEEFCFETPVPTLPALNTWSMLPQWLAGPVTWKFVHWPP